MGTPKEGSARCQSRTISVLWTTAGAGDVSETRAKSAGMKGLGAGRCRPSAAGPARQAASQAGGMGATEYLVPYQRSTSPHSACRDIGGQQAAAALEGQGLGCKRLETGGRGAIFPLGDASGERR